MSDYAAFLDAKAHTATRDGFDPVCIPDYLFPFQQALVEWACVTGRAAMFADCGMGKTLMQLVWADNVVSRTGGRVLILTPLAVAAQTVREAERFGIEARRGADGSPLQPGITVANYERLHLLDPADFVGVVCDESSILKSFDGTRRQQITDFMRKLRYRLLCTATAAPNDYTELGTSSEALGHLGYMDMLNRFFKNDQNNSGQGRLYGKAQAFRFKGHAELPFWRWVCSWARAVRKPSDIGFDDGDFTLPPLLEREYIIASVEPADGMLFAMPATTLPEQRDERRRTITDRCERVAQLVDTQDSALVWCHLNPEGDLLEGLIPGAVQVSGADSDEAKEEKFLAFASGECRVLVTKPKIGAWGLNFQHCAHIVSFPSHSYEQYYQAVRRCWRFGQTRPVAVDIVTTEGERGVLANLQRKAAQADRMFANLVEEMNRGIAIERVNPYTALQEAPSWL
jgi:hypothetical protein